MLKDQIRRDILVSLKSKDTVKCNLLRTLLGDCCKIDKEPSDTYVISIIKKFIKNAEETRSMLLPMSHVGEAIEKCSNEILILESYLPKQLSEQEIILIINDCKNSGSNFTLGSCMKYFKDKYDGQYDGSVVSKLAKEILS